MTTLPRIYDAVSAADGCAVEVANMMTVMGVVSVRTFDTNQDATDYRVLLSPDKARELADLLAAAADRTEAEVRALAVRSCTNHYVGAEALRCLTCGVTA
jgi:hypothetical protein